MTENELRKTILKRFLQYVQVETTSNPHSTTRPTTTGQLELREIVRKELEEMGIKEIYQDEKGFLIARIPTSSQSCKETIGFMTHFDTSDDVTAHNLQPRVHENYDGSPIMLKNNIILDPAEFPLLKKYKGDTIITSDGTTLLGADDKAGIAAVMSAVEYILKNALPHPNLEIIFTTDEETGMGMDGFPLDQVKSSCCYTFDGETEGMLEMECFNAYKAEIQFTGRSIHLGMARGKLINALTLASKFITLLSATELPETTDESLGYYTPLELSGNMEKCRGIFFIRDYEDKECLRRIEVLEDMARTLEKIYPGARIEVKTSKQYANMKNFFQGQEKVLHFLEEAVKKAGVLPWFKKIRGGTDGSRLSEMGIPTPNVFTGAQNFHSRQEWTALSVMVKSALTAVYLAELWAE